MTRPMSCELRCETADRKTSEVYRELEAWRDAHPDATYDEIEEEVRRRRLDVTSTFIELLINGRTTGMQAEALRCPECGHEMSFEDYRTWRVRGLEGETALERAYYRCLKCKRQGFFPLDEQLALRDDHLSEGAARVATRIAVRAPSFGQAAADYEDAIGMPLSRMSVWRVTTKAGEVLAAEKAREAEQAGLPAEPGEDPGEPRVAQECPIVDQGNISSDGVMVRLRDDGWKEAKIAAVSRVQVLPPKGTRPGEQPGRRDHDLRVKLDQHSYVVGVWDADEFGRYQYAEGLRRGLDTVETLTSVNDGAPWIGRVTGTNWPEATQILDWPHAAGHAYDVAKVVWGEGSAVGKQWAEARLRELWSGNVEDVLSALGDLNLKHYDWPEGETDPHGYFEDNAQRMRYDLFREAGYPIGSGTVESAAKNVVESRMRRPGRGWGTDNANGMLALLSEYHSGRFNKAWQLICKTRD